MYISFPLYSVPVPFAGDHQSLRQSPKWKKLAQTLPNDGHIVFADVVRKVNRANGKVGILEINYQTWQHSEYPM